MSDGLIHNSLELIQFGYRLTYKPGWTIRIESRKYDTEIGITIRMPAILSETGEPETIARLQTIDRRLGFEYPFEERLLVKIIRQFIGLFESHETDEWLRLDLQRVRNPHIVDK